MVREFMSQSAQHDQSGKCGEVSWGDSDVHRGSRAIAASVIATTTRRDTIRCETGFFPLETGHTRYVALHNQCMDSAISEIERWLRWAGPALLGLGLCAFVYVLGRMTPSTMSATAIAVIVSQVYVISEVCRALFSQLERRVGWSSSLGRRLLMQLALGAAVAIAYAVAVYVPIKLWLIATGEHDSIDWLHLAPIGLAALGAALCLSVAQFAVRFFAHWRQSELESARHQQESLRAQLEALQAQVNPHFLFNSLNVLYGVIAEDPIHAQALVLKLAEVFRYVLRHGNAQLVPLSDELAFLDAYMELLQARHGAALHIDLRLNGDEIQFLLPPMTLQLLVENAVKHNTLDPQSPLHIAIERDGEQLVVHHARRPRHGPVEGTGTGLSNVHRRFALLDAPPVKIRDETDQFCVSLPLLRGIS